MPINTMNSLKRGNLHSAVPDSAKDRILVSGHTIFSCTLDVTLRLVFGMLVPPLLLPALRASQVADLSNRFFLLVVESNAGKWKVIR
jgi:hypothetical protein